MLRATNKETGTGLTDRHVVAQSNSFVIAGELYTDIMLSNPAYGCICHSTERHCLHHDSVLQILGFLT